jgi:23S rRNA (guanosine2251-2'-O)-methyltransferase
VTVISGTHSVREALKNRRQLERVLIARGAGGPRIQEIVELCRDAGVPVRFESREQLDRAASTPAHQGVVAVAGAFRYGSIDDLPAGARLVVVLDGVEDPHNLGAIARTAHAAGAAAMIIPERRSAGVTDVVLKAAAGALEHLPVLRVGNVNRALEQLKDCGYWIYGLDERGTDTYDRIAYAAPTAIVLGGEGHGLHELVKRHCDALVSIPMAGQIPSLNVSVAAGVVLFEWKRRAGGIAQGGDPSRA